MGVCVRPTLPRTANNHHYTSAGKSTNGSHRGDRRPLNLPRTASDARNETTTRGLRRQHNAREGQSDAAPASE